MALRKPWWKYDPDVLHTLAELGKAPFIRGEDMVQVSKKHWHKVEGSAVLQCPKCGKQAHLDHDIDTDGKVTPSVVCPFKGCSFREFVQLKGWHDS